MTSKVTESKVTVLLPAYQAAEFIQPTLDSISAQSYGNMDVIVSVDACTDNTYDICVAHGMRDPRFTVIKQESRRGYVGNCNFLLGRADADYVLFAFHDDILSPEYVEKLSRALDQRPEAVLSFSDVLLTRVNGEREHWAFACLEGDSNRLSRGLKMLDRPHCWWVPNRGLFRLGEARRIRGLKTHGAGEFSVDWPWLYHMSLLGEFVRVPETLCFKYYQPDSLSRSWAFSERQWSAVTHACLRETWISPLSLREKYVLSRKLVHMLKGARRRMRREKNRSR